MTLVDIRIARMGEAVVTAIAEHVTIEGTTLDERKRIVADVLVAAAEYGGVVLPKVALKLNPDLTTKTFPGGIPALTTKGLVRFYENKGWRYMVLRVGPLLRAFTGQNERLQEVFALYEAQCAGEGVTHVPDFADGPAVAGGTAPSSAFSAMLDTVEPARQ